MRTPWIVLAVAIAALAAYLAWPVDDATRVRETVRRAARAFTDGRAGDGLDAFDLDYEDRSGGREIDRETIRLALLGALGRRGGPTWIARIVDDEVSITELRPDDGVARVSFVAELLRGPADSAYTEDTEVIWQVAIEADLRRGDDGTWRFLRSTHRTQAGRPPYR